MSRSTRAAGDHSAARRRTFSWEDPIAAAHKGLTMSGIEALRAMAAGTLPPPPIAVLMGFEGVEAEEGRVVVSVRPAEYHYSNTGAAHGGLAATLLDSVMYLAVHSTLGRRVFASTLEIKVNFVRPMMVATGAATGEGHVVHRGRTIALAEGTVRDADDRLLAHGTTTCLIRGA